GPHLHNLAEISRRLGEAGALLIAEDADGIAQALDGLLADPQARAKIAESGRALVEQGRGALARTLQMIDADLPGPMAT
ncbi:MAG: glycosyltransferase, partial [Pseudoxanthomonas sp.]